MKFHVVTLFPEMIEASTQVGVVGQAVKDGRLSVKALNPRAFTSNVHQTVDDRPFGGGDGMVMLIDPLLKSIEHIRSQASGPVRVVHLSPRGKVLNDRLAREWAKQGGEIVLIASRYGGVDQRFLSRHVDDELSIGDYVLSGGELGALVAIDAIARHIPGVLGNEASADEESFATGLLEYPQFTRPREWGGDEVPSALLSGDHAKIALWRRDLSILVTADRRPDLLALADVKRVEIERALALFGKMSESERLICGLGDASAIEGILRREMETRPEDSDRRKRRTERRKKKPKANPEGNFE